MKKPTFLWMAACLAGSLAFAVSGAAGQSIYTDGHGDLGVEYTPGETEFEPHWHLGAGAMVDGALLLTGEEFAPEELVARLSVTANVGDVSVANALGVSTGTVVYRTGITAYPPNLGFGLEEVGAPGDWLDEIITLTLSGFSGPGEMAISQTVSGLGTFVWFSSRGDGYTVDDNHWGFAVGGHQHNDWWFSEAGVYEITFDWSGTYIGGGEPVPVTGSGTFGFQVDVIPEPGTWGLLAAGCAVLILLRRGSLARWS